MGWLDGTVRQAKPEHLDFALSRWRTILAEGLYLVPLTTEMSEAFRAERARTGVGTATLLKSTEDVPKGLTRPMLAQWIGGSRKSIRKDYLDWILTAWAALPDVAAPDLSGIGIDTVAMQQGRVVLDEALREKIIRFAETTGKSGRGLMVWARRNGIEMPEGFSAGVVAQWLNGRTGTALPEHLCFAIETWQAIERAVPPEGPISDDQRARLEHYRTLCLLPSGVLEGADDKPKGLTRAVIASWLDGKPKTVREDYLTWVLTRCEDLTRNGTHRVPVTKDTRDWLIALRQRSGVTQTNLLRGRRDVPDGLSAQIITGWINAATKTARKDHLDYVIALWERLAREAGRPRE